MASKKWNSTTNYPAEMFEIKVGSKVIVDGWGYNEYTSLVESDWDKADFRVLTHQPVIESLAVGNFKITGSTVQYRDGGQPMVRMSFEFIGDDEPNTSHGGWLRL